MSMFKYVVSVFSPSWEDDGTEGRVTLYEGNERMKALKEWKEAKTDMWPQCEIIVLGREGEHYSRKVVDDCDDYDDYDDVETWTFKDGFKCYGKAYMFDTYTEDVLIWFLGHGQVISKQVGQKGQYVKDVVYDYEHGRTTHPDYRVEIYAKDLCGVEHLICTTRNIVRQKTTVSGDTVWFVPDSKINVPEDLDSWWTIEHVDDYVLIDDVGSMSHHLYMKEITGSCVRVYNSNTQNWEYEWERKVPMREETNETIDTFTVTEDEDLPF